ncbi:MAG: hypothetical protein JST87_10250 [Bacteroidetes bacterium]|nr:hypothetical protein [Bacteroidota bacterium]
MTRLFLTTTFALTFAACSTNSSHEITNTDTTTATITTEIKSGITNSILADTAKVKTWLIGVIEDYTNSQDLKHTFENLKKSLTDNYYNYKQDAINLEYDNGDTTVSEEAFKKKWQDKYNIKYVGNGGFIISTQDNGKIKVTKCNFIKNIGQNASLYKVLIEDLDFKTKFNRDIKLLKVNSKLFIDDVIEYD